MRIKLDRTVCDGFGICAKHAPEYFSLDDWGYASLSGGDSVPKEDRDAVMRALMDCPVHAIREIGGDEPPHAEEPASSTDVSSIPELKTEENEAEWGFIR